MRIILQPQRGVAAASCDLHESISSNATAVSVIAKIASSGTCVFSDVPYQARIEWAECDIPSKIKFYLNGELLEHYIFVADDEYTIVNFQSTLYSNGNIFRDCYGYVQLEIECIWEQEGRTLSYLTDYFGVMIRATKINEALHKMAKFVYQNHRKYMWKKRTLPLGAVSITETDDKSLDAQIELIKHVIRVYEHNLAVFKTKPHTRVEQVHRFDDFDKLQRITPQTLYFISQHPEELSISSCHTGINFKNIDYYPRRTLILNTEQSRDCYENRMVLGFICTVISTIDSLIQRIEQYLNAQQPGIPTVEGYVSSTIFILQTSRHHLERMLADIALSKSRLEELFWSYKSYLQVDAILINNPPEATAVFRLSPPYRQVYAVMIKWFSFGCYDFSSEEFLLPLLVNHQLYEYYTLFKMLSALEENGYRYLANECANFKYPVRSALYSGVDHLNTFYFQNEHAERITLYYQPVIWGQQYTDALRNGISLRRSTSISLEQDDSTVPFKLSNAFYTPDYIIKFQKGESERYIIVDAKLQSVVSVWNRQISKLAFKYQFSIRPTKSDSALVGILVLYGKSVDKASSLDTVHDIYFDDHSPFFWLSSLTESDSCSEDSQARMMANVIQALRTT